MKGILNVLSFTFREQARKKSFIISTVITYLIVFAIICIPSIISSFSSSSKDSTAEIAANKKSDVYVIDEGNIISDSKDYLSSTLQNCNFIFKNPSDKNEIVNKIKENDKLSLIEINSKNGVPTFNLYVKSETGIGSGAPGGDELCTAVRQAYNAKILKDAGVPAQTIGKVAGDIKYSTIPVGKGTVGGMFASFAVTFFLFFAIYMYGYWVAMSIASEKTSRVMEVLITSTKPSRIIIGKSLGMGLLGFCELLGLIIVAGAGYNLLYPKNFAVGGTAINLSTFSPLVIIMMLLYFIFGFALYAMLNAVCGATVSKSEDIQQAIMPLSMIAMVSFYFAYMTSMAPESPAAVAASLIPFSAPFSMPSRMLSANIPAWQIVLSLLILAGTTVLMCFISIKLYSSAVLHYGKRLKISELIRMSKAK